MPLTLVGVSGRKRHGKDQVATYLESYGVKRLAFADELKRVAMNLWDLSFEQVYGSDEYKEAVDERWGLSPRTILQQLGTQVGRNIHDQTWVRKALSTIERAQRGEPVVLPNMVSRRFEEVTFAEGWADRWAVPDVRFPGEADAIKARGGVVIKVVRPGMPTGDMHASETEVDNVQEDHLIVNDGSLGDLETRVREIAYRIFE